MYNFKTSWAIYKEKRKNDTYYTVCAYFYADCSKIVGGVVKKQFNTKFRILDGALMARAYMEKVI